LKNENEKDETKMKKLKLVKHVLTLAIVLALVLVVSSIPVVAAPADLTPYVTVTSWGFYHENGMPVSTTDPLSMNYNMAFSFDWEVNLPPSQTISSGDTFRLPRPYISGHGIFQFPNSGWQNFHSIDSTLLGQWRIEDNHIEVVFAIESVSSVSGGFHTGPIIRHQVEAGGVRNVTFAGHTRTMNFRGRILDNIDGRDQVKGSATPSASQIRWFLQPNIKGARELGGIETGHPRGEYFTLLPGFFVEDTLQGDFYSATFQTHHRIPHSLDLESPRFGEPSNVMIGSIPFTAHMQRIIPNPGESRIDFRERLQPFNMVYGKNPLQVYKHLSLTLALWDKMGQRF